MCRHQCQKVARNLGSRVVVQVSKQVAVQLRAGWVIAGSTYAGELVGAKGLGGGGSKQSELAGSARAGGCFAGAAGAPVA